MQIGGVDQIGKFLLAGGLAIAVIGALLWLGGGRGFGWIGRLPGDIHMQGERGSFHFPVVTCILVSVVLSVVMAIIRRFTSGS